MGKSTEEREWKYMREVQDDLLSELCRRINEKSVAILNAPGKSEHEKYLEHYKHVQDSDDIVAECFNDWRRSTLVRRLIALHRHDLLRSQDLEKLSEKTRDTINALAEI